MKPGDEVWCKKRTKWMRARVVEIYQQPKAVKIEYAETFERWILKPEEVKTPEEKEAEEQAERDAQAQ